MEVLFHFCFQLIKTGLLSLVYLGIVLLIIRIKPFSDASVSKRISERKSTRIVIGGTFFVLLFLWQFTHWGDHGLGDYARIPLRHFREIEQINSRGMYIRPKGHTGETLPIAYYSVSNDHCFGKLTRGDHYFIWELASNTITLFDAPSYYLFALDKLTLESTEVIGSFSEGYDDYWMGWRFWLLP